MSMNKKASLVGTIESLLQSVGADTVKTAGNKRSEAYTEAGGYAGASTHPTTKADDRTEAASEGARSAENTDDVKNEPNRGAPVDSVSAGPGAGQDSVQTNIGMTSKATGEDPSAETDSAKGGKDDPGSSHPARTDNDSLDGHKYASNLEALNALCKKAEALGEQICAYIATNANPTKRAEGSAAGSTNCQAGGIGVKDGPVTTEGKVEAKRDGAPTVTGNCGDKAAQAGYDLAGIFANLDVATQDKQAADRMVVDGLQQVIATAIRRAEKCAEFYAAHFDPRNQKLAEGEDSGKSDESERAKSDESDSGGSSGAAPDASGGGAGPTPEEEALLMKLLSGGQGMGGDDALAGMAGGDGDADDLGGMGGDPSGGGMPPGGDPMGGGMPPGGDPSMGGGMPPGGGGDPMGGAGGGMPPGGAGGEVDPAMLQQILAELGVSPEQVQGKVAAARKARQKQATARTAQRTKWQPKTAADREKYARMKQVITEITGRSRG